MIVEPENGCATLPSFVDRENELLILAKLDLLRLESRNDRAGLLRNAYVFPDIIERDDRLQFVTVKKIIHFVFHSINLELLFLHDALIG